MSSTSHRRHRVFCERQLLYLLLGFLHTNGGEMLVGKVQSTWYVLPSYAAAMDSLLTLIDAPSFATEFCGKVDLIKGKTKRDIEPEWPQERADSWRDGSGEWWQPWHHERPPPGKHEPPKHEPWKPHPPEHTPWKPPHGKPPPWKPTTHTHPVTVAPRPTRWPPQWP